MHHLHLLPIDRGTDQALDKHLVDREIDVTPRLSIYVVLHVILHDVDVSMCPDWEWPWFAGDPDDRYWFHWLLLRVAM